MFKDFTSVSQGASPEESGDDSSANDMDTPFVALPASPLIPPNPPVDHTPVLTPPVKRSSRPRNNPQRYGNYVYYRTELTVIQSKGET